jgi:hypothetical protein
MHMVNAAAPILAWVWHTLVNVDAAHVPCDTTDKDKKVHVTFMSAVLLLNTMDYKLLTSSNQQC